MRLLIAIVSILLFIAGFCLMQSGAKTWHEADKMESQGRELLELAKTMR